MSIKLAFEVAHVAQRKTKPAKGGFTHDWELYVRSPNKEGDLSHFVEKVVFNLHDTFVKPKRSIKEPPFEVKESGYAAFEVLIEVYLKNRDEPRKFTFTYDLDLQPMKSEIKEFVIDNPSDDFRRKCLKGGCVLIGGGGGGSTNVEYKKPKRPDDSKTNKIFTDLFGAPLEKQQISKADRVPHGGPPEKFPLSSSSKDKEKSSKHKHAGGDSKESKKSSESRSGGSEKIKKDKNKDRERSSDKKDKSKRPPSPSRPTGNVQNLQNSNLTSSTGSSSVKNEYAKPTHAAKPQPSIPEMSSNKKSSKKKNYEKDREKNERKESAKPSKEKAENSLIKKEKEIHSKNEERQKQQMIVESKPPPPSDVSKKYDKDADRKHKHKKEKKEKTKEKEVKEKERKEPKVKSQPLPVKPKPPLSDKESDSDSDSVSVKQEEPIPEIIPQKTLTPDKSHKKASSSRADKTAKGSTEKETDTKKRKRKVKDPSRSPSPTPPKQSKRDYSPQVEKSKDNSSLNSAGNIKVTNEYLDELKDLKQKINTLQTKELSHVVRLIASTGHYEITNSSFDFDLVKLDKSTVQRLQEFLATS